LGMARAGLMKVDKGYMVDEAQKLSVMAIIFFTNTPAFL